MGDGMRVPPMKLPEKLYDLVVEAVELGKSLKANPENPKFVKRLNYIESGIRLLGNIYKKKKVLPRDWKFVLDIATTLVDNGCLVKLKESDIAYPKPRPVPQTSGIPLTEEEKQIWQCFIETDKETPALGSISLSYPEKERRPIVLEDPMVGVIGNFAVDTFNKVYEMLVNEKEQKRINRPEFLKLSYIKMKGIYSVYTYYFYMTMKAFEKGKEGLYETKVVCEMPRDVPDGCKRLSRFVLTEPEPTPTPTPIHKEIAAEVLLTEEDKCKEVTCSSSSESEDEDRYGNPGSRTGMIRRRKGATCRGYDFYTPRGFDGP
ncbi:uncharacterized protein [Rutidosis leptorrhynchoides]|uniref:uncharacterized protein n=1 Tax=Rutidosis leptorrhynchoides TaxID=125765 RepID=UPI003A98FF7D